MRIIEVLKIVFVFAGAVIGAGFATGREILLFFGDYGASSAIITGLLMGVTATVFLLAGKYEVVDNFKKCRFFYCIEKFKLIVINTSMLLTLVAMTGGLKELCYQIFSCKFSGIVIALLCCVFCTGKDKYLKAVNFILVPIIAILVIILCIMSAKNQQINYLPFGIKNCIGYLSMNMLLGGYLIKDGAKSLNNKQIMLTGILCAAIMALLMYCVYAVAINFRSSDMPILEFCNSQGIRAVGLIIILTAVITTVCGCYKYVGNYLSTVKFTQSQSKMILSVITLASYGWSFSTAINVFYPFIAVVSSSIYFYELLAFVLLVFRLKASKRKSTTISLFDKFLNQSDK